MKSTNTVNMAVAVASCATGLFIGFLATASPASADALDPPPAPVPVPGPVVPAPALAQAPDAAATVQAAGTEVTPPPPDGVPHLASPDALPPGSTLDPSVMAGESPNVSYLKDLWHAVQNQEISGKEALLLGVAQRGMNTPIPDQAPGPNVPTSPPDPAPAALPADAPPPALAVPPTP